MRHLQTSQFPKHIPTIYITNLPGEGAREGGIGGAAGFRVSSFNRAQNSKHTNKNAKPPQHGNIGNGKHS